MKIAVIGAGAIGSVVAAGLFKSNVDVLLVGRADQVAAIKERGLTIKRFDGTETLNVPVAERLDREFDLVIFTTKTQDVDDAYMQNSEFMENCLVLATQNGVQGDNILSPHFFPERVISSIVMFGATYVKPGEVTYNFPGDWIIGKRFVMNDIKVHEIADILKKSFSVEVTDNILGMKWLKLFVNFNNCIPALIGKSMQETFTDMDLCRLSVSLLKEALPIVQSANIKLVSLPQFPVERVQGLAAMPLEQGAGIMNKTLTGLSKEPLYGSILQSILRGKTSEIDFINGEVVAIASGMRMDAPLNRKVVRMVHTVEETGKFFSAEEVKKEFSLV
ncbi:MAG: 2-dehydropantoate 2-reductase [Candidatus Omnitrophica bacterium]|nr:2-dehydropantoate 2-reductase [Candidatus Omnitrophota bacterium]